MLLNKEDHLSLIEIDNNEEFQSNISKSSKHIKKTYVEKETYIDDIGNNSQYYNPITYMKKKVNDLKETFFSYKTNKFNKTMDSQFFNCSLKLNRHNKGNEKKDNDEYNHLRPDDKLISKSSKIKEPSLNKKSQSSISSSTEKKNNNIKTETFLEFFSDFCNNLMYYMPFSLKILLRIVYTQANSIFTISEKDRTYPIFILLFFKFYCNPQFHSLYDFPNDDINKNKLINLNKLFIKIASNTKFQIEKESILNMKLNSIIEICHEKLKSIIHLNVISLSNDLIMEKSVEILPFINCPVNLFYNDCEFIRFCLCDDYDYSFS